MVETGDEGIADEDGGRAEGSETEGGNEAC